MHVQVAAEQPELAARADRATLRLHRAGGPASAGAGAPVPAAAAAGPRPRPAGRLRPEAVEPRPTQRQPVVKSEWDKTPRNAPCPCGSGKKYKLCHGAGG